MVRVCTGLGVGSIWKGNQAVRTKTAFRIECRRINSRREAKQALKYPPEILTGIQAQAVGRGLARKISLSNYTVWACAILPEHTHLVVARHSYAVEKIANLLKGAATRQLKEAQLHPLADYANAHGKLPSVWAARQWKVYLDNEQAIDEAIHYVETNPEKENKPPQEWSFVTRFSGIPTGGSTTYH